jgi:hypothetical protein
VIFDSILNRGEYLSNHYLDVLIKQDLAGLRARWEAAEKQGGDTARSRVRSLSRSYFAAKADATDHDPLRVEAVRVVHDAVLTALGFPPDRQHLTLVRGAQELDIPVAHIAEGATGLILLALDLGLAFDLDAALDASGAGALLDPILVGAGGKDKLVAATEAVSAVFSADAPPRWVLLLAGGLLVLADRATWAEGRFLACDLDLALDRGDAKTGGELEAVAALFSADVLLPVEGEAVLDQLTTASKRHAVGVSKELRGGIRESVELLANEVIEQRKAANLAVYSVADLPGQLTTQCLRFLYRLLVLLFAEARSELGILPTDYPEYEEGYGLDRLRDLALTPLTTDKSRTGGHIHESLQILFRLVNDGYHHAEVQEQLVPELASADVGLRFEPLRSDLFSSEAVPLLDGVRLRNEALQRVLALLLLSKEHKGRERGFVSYAQLGINQLGAVYEGLMAYTGFFADEDLYEVAHPGAGDKGTWVVPVARAEEYPDDVFVTRPHPTTGQPVRVRHPKGSFVFRLSGRNRQRSASYYTPEVLTRCVVKHALAELLDQNGETTPARRILDLTICEPALGSGAFLNEAINQLAAEYLRRRQAELGKALDPDRYAIELQRTKAHLALHQCYGVDLNATAVELAEVSLWLNAVHAGLQAPWFGLHLRRGNSLVGARRATYREDQLAKAAWLKSPPTDRPLADGPLADGEIHHFLLPAHGWAAIAETKQARALRPDAVERLRRWRRAVAVTPTPAQIGRLLGLSRLVELQWQLAGERLRQAERELRRRISVWGSDREATRAPASREHVQTVLRDAHSALGRLRLVMDAWCALWFWSVDGPEPPTIARWLDALEGLLGVRPVEAIGQLDFFESLDDFVEQELGITSGFGARQVGDVMADHPWLAEVQRIAKREGFWHWELEFAPVFSAGGFDLQVGNPPWVRPTWEDDVTLAELDPWFGVMEQVPEKVFAARRATVLAAPIARDAYVADLSSATGLNEMLGCPVLHSILAGIQNNLYMVFMDTTWRNAGRPGVIGLLHPESHFADPKAGRLRRETYRRLRRHFQFINQAKLFEDVHNTTNFGVQIYGNARDPLFLQISSLLDPAMVDRSLGHDGTGELPGIQFAWGGWDLRPHLARVLRIDEHVLASWARLFDEPGTLPIEARLLHPLTSADLEAFEVLAAQPMRLADHEYQWTAGFHEKGAKEDGLIRWETSVPAAWDEVILQGPHFTVATPFAKQPNEGCKSNKDYLPWNLELLPERVIPRTNYQRACDRDTYDTALDHWRGRPSTASWRHIHREMTQPGLERSVQGALLPPGPAHIHACLTYSFDDRHTLVRFAGLMATLPVDYVFKASAAAHVAEHQLKRLPLPKLSAYDAALFLRTLRLNCLTADYAPLWEELYDPTWRKDAWAAASSESPALGDVGPEWTMTTPLRTASNRRMALVELDALSALMLGLSAEQLCAMYRAQFAVLRKYEYAMWFDSRGRRVPVHVVGAWQAHPGSASLDGHELPFIQPDREKEMTRAYEEFRRRFGGRQ